MNGAVEVQAVKDRLRRRLLEYTRMAYRMLPPLERPRILDIGCGSGVVSLELARLSRGQVTGLDIDATLLQVFAGKIDAAGLRDRVIALLGDMARMDFPWGSFDVIWAEGSISAIGFARGLGEWHPFLKPSGFLVVHDDAEGLGEKLGHISAGGYELLGSFIVDERVWWKRYYAPLERAVCIIRVKVPADPGVLALLEAEEREVAMARHHPHRCRSVFFLMKKVP
jgi:SAM-dependent methyltransferase